MLTSTLPPELIRAYRETHYRVLAEPPFTLHIDAASTPLLELHAQRAVACSAFVTACNPHSTRLDAHANAGRQQALRARLEAAGHAPIDGVSQHPDNGWPPEPSLLVPGLDEPSARALALACEQNAFVWAGSDGVARLVLLR